MLKILTHPNKLLRKKSQEVTDIVGDKILEINSTDPQILARKGHLLEITFQHQNALLCLNKALEIDPL